MVPRRTFLFVIRSLITAYQNLTTIEHNAVEWWTPVCSSINTWIMEFFNPILIIHFIGKFSMKGRMPFFRSIITSKMVNKYRSIVSFQVKLFKREYRETLGVNVPKLSCLFRHFGQYPCWLNSFACMHVLIYSRMRMVKQTCSACPDKCTR